MATLSETAEWVDVYQLEEEDPVLGGEPNEATGAGMDNIPHLHLTKRTSWLRAAVIALQEALQPATTEVAGIVQLNNSLTSTSTSQALTAAQGKALQDAKAPLASPGLTGTPTAPTAPVGTSSTQIATTAFTHAAIAGKLVDNLTSTATDAALTAAQGKVLQDTKAPLASPGLTGTPTAPTAAAATNTGQIATTAFTQSAISAKITNSLTSNATDAALSAAQGKVLQDGKAPLASPAFTGTPTGPSIGTPESTTAQLVNMQTAHWVISYRITDNLTTAMGTQALSAAQGKVLQDTKAPLASPALTGTPTAPTAPVATDSTQIATTAFVKDAAIGWDQTWQNVAASRAQNTSYQNTTGKPITVCVMVPEDYFFQVSSNNSTWVNLTSGAGEQLARPWDSTYATIPPGHYYRCTGPFTLWTELR